MNLDRATGTHRTDVVDHLTGRTVVLLMRRHGKTVEGLARLMNVTQVRVRHVRDEGVQGQVMVMDWAEAITGTTSLTWALVGDLYLGEARRAMPMCGTRVRAAA